MLTRQTAFPAAPPDRVPKLRRLDWRFLLPNPPAGRFRHLLLSGGPKGLADRILEAKLAEQVSSDATEGDRADAAILLYDGPIQLDQAAKSLEPGAVVYQEIARTSPSAWPITPDQLRSQFRQVGLTITGLYWAAPNHEDCRRYIPLDFPDALHWYFSALFVAGTPLHHAIRAAFRLIMRHRGHWAARLAPHWSVTAVMGSADVRPPSVLDAPHIGTILQPVDLRPMILTSGQDDGSRVIMLVFAPRHSHAPEAVIKIATDPKFNVETDLEQTVLHEVRARLDTKMRQSVPEPLGNFHFRHLAIGVERCAPGQSLWASSGSWGVSPHAKLADLELGVAWLTEFHRQTEVTRQSWDAEAIGQWVETPLAAYAQARDIAPAERRLFTVVRAHAQRLIGAELPLAWQHSDFAPWNLFRAGDRLTVIDWEFNRRWESTRAGPVLCDLLYFVTYWNHVANHLYSEEAELSGLYDLFLNPAPGNRYVRAARKAVAQYIEAIRIDPRFLPLLLVYTWMERAVYSHARARKLETHTAPNRAADKFARYLGLLARHADLLFSDTSSWQQIAPQIAGISTKAPNSGGSDDS